MFLQRFCYANGIRFRDNHKMILNILIAGESSLDQQYDFLILEKRQIPIRIHLFAYVN